MIAAQELDEEENHIAPNLQAPFRPQFLSKADREKITKEQNDSLTKQI